MKKSYIVAALTVVVVSGLYLGQQQLSAQAVLPTRQYTPNEAVAGITLTANTHNFFSCEDESLRWPVVKSDTGNGRFWLYEFTGEEPPFTGNFYISAGELTENPQLKPIDTLRAFKGGARYYAMSQHDLFFKCGEHIRITPRCGDGVQNGAEQCDDGNNRNGDGCSAQCNVESICGNGRLEEGEECDDSNRGNYDGCSEECAVEDGFTCQSEPSACEPMIPTLPGGGSTSSQPSSSGQESTRSNPSSAARCIETDDGSDFHVQGTATLGGNSNTDTCQNETALLEYTCAFGFMEGIIENCEFGCSDGACLHEGEPGERGNLFITKHYQPLRNRQLLGGTTDEPIMILEMRAEHEDIAVTKIQFSDAGSTDSIDRLELYRKGATQPFAIATEATCNGVTTELCANMLGNQLVIPVERDVPIYIRPIMKTDEQGGDSGEDFQLFLHDSGDIEAIGLLSRDNLQENDGNTEASGEIFVGTYQPAPDQIIEGTQNEVVMSKIISITNANSDANGSAIPMGQAPVGQFKFTAAEHRNSRNGLNDVVLDDLIFSVNANNLALSSYGFTFYNKADQTKQESCKPHYLTGEPITSENISGTFLLHCSGFRSSDVDTEIDQGTSQTFVVSANITSPKISTTQASTLQISLENFSQIDEESPHIQWYDTDAGTSESFDWVEYPETVVRSTVYEN